jgi:hypothetical protein
MIYFIEDHELVQAVADHQAFTLRFVLTSTALRLRLLDLYREHE